MAARKEVYIMSFPKGAFSGAAIETVKADFKKAGIVLIAVPFNNNSVGTPRFERVPK